MTTTNNETKQARTAGRWQLSGAFVYELNTNKINKFHFDIAPGFADDGKRTTLEWRMALAEQIVSMHEAWDSPAALRARLEELEGGKS